MWDALTRTLLALTFVTGILDAVRFLALGIGAAPGAALLAALEPEPRHHRPRLAGRDRRAR